MPCSRGVHRARAGAGGKSRSTRRATPASPPTRSRPISSPARKSAGASRPKCACRSAFPPFSVRSPSTPTIRPISRWTTKSLPVGGDTLVLPEGTTLRIAGRATTPLRRVSMAGPGGARPLAVGGVAFHGEIVPVSGSWRLVAQSADGDALGGDLPTFAVRIVPDSAPSVDIPIPGIDTVAPASLRLAIVVAARDDHGVTSAAIEAHRSTSAAIIRLPLPLPAGASGRALVPAVLDLAALGLGAGDTLRYDAVAVDNSPDRHTGRSREYQVRIPTEAEQRAARQLATAATATAFDSVRGAAGRVQQDADDLSREQVRSGQQNGRESGDGGAPGATLPLEMVRRAQATADAQQKVLDEAARLQQSVNQLAQTARQRGLADSALARQLDEISHLLDQAMTPALRARLDALRAALQSLDPDRTRTALQDLARDEAQLKQALDQATELFKRAALETRLANLAETAHELAGDQRQLTPDLARSDSSGAADQERASGDPRRFAWQRAAAGGRSGARPGDGRRAARRVPSGGDGGGSARSGRRGGATGPDGGRAQCRAAGAGRT